MSEPSPAPAASAPPAPFVPRPAPSPAAPRRERSRLASTAAGARRLLALDRELETRVLAGREYRERRRLVRWSRWAVQALFLALVLWVGVEFVRWVHGLEQGQVVGHRPGGVEAFLPISALLSLRHLFSTGVVHPVHPAGLVIFLLVALSGLLLKRAFCSWVCPVGTISELLAKLGERLFGRRLRLPRPLDLPLRGVKYLLLAFFVWVIVFQMTPLAIAAFLDAPYNRVADIKMLRFFENPTPLTLKVLAALVTGSVLVPYLWCRYLCPYGALLGLLSLVSPLKVTRRRSSCIDCGLCTRACPANLPVERLSRVRSDECFACLSCVAACPVPDALQLRPSSRWRRALRPGWVAVAVLLLFGGGMLAAKAAGLWESNVPDQEFLWRMRELDFYDHARGLAPARPTPAQPAAAADRPAAATLPPGHPPLPGGHPPLSRQHPRLDRQALAPSH